VAKDIKDQLNDYIKNLPSLPVTVHKILEICNDPHLRPADLNHVISMDPILVGQVLKLVNSAYYGLPQHVTSMVRAIIMLGINTVKNMALSSAIMSSFKLGKKAGINLETIWRHSLCVAVSAKMLARSRGIDIAGQEEYFTAGLLHDIGKIPLNVILGDKYLLIADTAVRRERPLHEIEKVMLGFNHCDTGAMIMDAWKLTGSIHDAIVYHHNYTGYTGPFKDIVYSIVLVDCFANSWENDLFRDMFQDQDKELLKYLRVDQKMFDQIEVSVNEEIEKARIFLNL
jgi:putative nucleotidyltransferase with HDIG domain